jgi:superfamily I DNA/RNA helicase
VATLIENDGELVKKKVFSKRSKYGDLKVIFVDEAQDLNETQYKIIRFLQEATGSTVHLIGDPNQNIYQFRQSYERYMLNHEGKKFYLTRNFRCDASIEDFSNYFQYYKHANGQREEFGGYSPKVTIQLLNQYENDNRVVELLKQLR